MRCHRSSNGKMMECHAEKRACPYGGDATHRDFADRTSVDVWNQADQMERDSHYLMESLKGMAEHGIPVKQSQLEKLVEMNEEMQASFRRNADFAETPKYRRFELSHGGPREIMRTLWSHGAPTMEDYEIAVNRIAMLPAGEGKVELGKRLLAESYRLADFEDGVQYFEYQKASMPGMVGERQRVGMVDYFNKASTAYRNGRDVVLHGLGDSINRNDLAKMRQTLEADAAYRRSALRQRLTVMKSEARRSAMSIPMPAIPDPPAPVDPPAPRRRTNSLSKRSGSSGAGGHVAMPPRPIGMVSSGDQGEPHEDFDVMVFPDDDAADRYEGIARHGLRR